MHYYIVAEEDEWGEIPENFDSVKLKEGVNYYRDEIIVMNKMKYCYEITTKPVENYEHQSTMNRVVKMFFPKYSDIAYKEQNMTYYDLFYSNSFHVFFTSEEYSYPIELGLQTQREETFEVKMRKNTGYEVSC